MQMLNWILSVNSVFQTARKAGQRTDGFLGLQQCNSPRSTAAYKWQNVWCAKPDPIIDWFEELREGTDFFPFIPFPVEKHWG